MHLRAWLCCVLVCLCLSGVIVRADQLSVNSGGDEELIIHPEGWIEGMFAVREAEVATNVGGTAQWSLTTPRFTRADKIAIGIIVGSAIMAMLIIVIVYVRRKRR